MNKTTFSKSLIKFDNSSVLPTKTEYKGLIFSPLYFVLVGKIRRLPFHVFCFSSEFSAPRAFVGRYLLFFKVGFVGESPCVA